MNKLITTNPGGMPVTQYTLEFMQKTYSDSVAAICNALGDNVILPGVEDKGTTYSSGYVIMNKELLFFIGGMKDSQIVVDEKIEQRIFEDGISREMYVTRVAKCGNAGGVNIGDFKTLDTVLVQQGKIAAQQQSILDLTTTINSIKPYMVPTGTIVMWAGTTAPTGWALCDGQLGRPDLRGRFVVGYSSNDVDYSSIGNIGGEAKHKLTIAEMPSHMHSPGTDIYRGNRNKDASGGTQAYSTEQTGSNSAPPTNITAKTGGDQPHENRPPYYTLAYIIKL